jgi:hypothetical protein
VKERGKVRRYEEYGLARLAGVGGEADDKMKKLRIVVAASFSGTRIGIPRRKIHAREGRISHFTRHLRRHMAISVHDKEPHRTITTCHIIDPWRFGYIST